MFNVTKFIDYLVLVLLLGFTGIPFFIFAGSTFLILLFPIPAAVYFYRKGRMPKFVLFYLIYVITLLMGQTLKFYFLPIETYLGIILKVLFAFFVLEILKEKFIPYYVNIIYFVTIVSFFFYFLSYVPGFEATLSTKIAPLFENPFIDYSGHYKVWPNVIIYTANSGGNESAILRNSGPFWEPGAFAGFLVIALIFNISYTKQIWHYKSRILIIGLITTLSTTGILSLFVIISGYLLANQKAFVKLITIPMIIGLGSIAYNSFDFLGAKIDEKMDVENAQYNTRFKSAQIDLMDTLENPILGLGRNVKTRFKGETDPVKNHRNNGVTDFMASMGMVTFILYFFLIYYSFATLCKVKSFPKEFAIYAIVLIIMIGFSEGYFFRPFFYSLTMLHVYVKQLKPDEIYEEE